MRNILLLISMLGLLPAGCGHTVSDTDTVSCDTFVYSVKGGDSLRLDRYTDTPAAEIDAKKPCMIFVFGGASSAARATPNRTARSSNTWRANRGTPSFRSTTGSA